MQEFEVFIDSHYVIVTIAYKCRLYIANLLILSTWHSFLAWFIEPNPLAYRYIFSSRSSIYWKIINESFLTMDKYNPLVISNYYHYRKSLHHVLYFLTKFPLLIHSKHSKHQYWNHDPSRSQWPYEGGTEGAEMLWRALG